MRSVQPRTVVLTYTANSKQYTATFYVQISSVEPQMFMIGEASNTQKNKTTDVLVKVSLLLLFLCKTSIIGTIITMLKVNSSDPAKAVASRFVHRHSVIRFLIW